MDGDEVTGFQAMSPERRRELASLGGRTAHANGRGHRFTPAESRKGAAARMALVPPEELREHMRLLGARSRARGMGKGRVWTPEEARALASAGGKASAAKRRERAAAWLSSGVGL